ncbi:hypothetical protein EV2_009373 [Malus domestica]
MADMVFGKEAQATQRTRLSVSSSSDQDVLVKAINLDHRRAMFFMVLYILSVPQGAQQPCLQTFAADQFDENMPEDISRPRALVLSPLAGPIQQEHDPPPHQTQLAGRQARWALFFRSTFRTIVPSKLLPCYRCGIYARWAVALGFGGSSISRIAYGSVWYDGDGLFWNFLMGRLLLPLQSKSLSYMSIKRQ